MTAPARPGPHLLYVVGASGSGKTALLRTTLQPFEATAASVPITVKLRTYQIPITLYGPDSGPFSLTQLGRGDGQYSGTDTLAQDVQPAAVELLRRRIVQAMRHPDRQLGGVIAEGDRLGNQKFLDAATALGYQVTCVYVQTAPAIAAARQAARGQVHHPNATQRHEHQVRGCVAAYGAPAWTFDGAAPRSRNAVRLRDHPIFDQLMGRGH